MPELTRDLEELTPPFSDAIEYVLQLKKAGTPAVLSINGKVELVVRDAGSFSELLRLIEWVETVEAIREGLASIDRGEGRPAAEVFEEIRRKYKAPSNA